MMMAARTMKVVAHSPPVIVTTDTVEPGVVSLAHAQLPAPITISAMPTSATTIDHRVNDALSVTSRN